MNGTAEKQEAEVRMVTSEGRLLMIEDKAFFASFKDFPYLADLPSHQIFKMEYLGHGHIRWKDADIDLHTKILANPEKYPVIMHPVKHSPKPVRKSAARRGNGVKGGHSHKKTEPAFAWVCG